jgi:hypothetical protein
MPDVLLIYATPIKSLDEEMSGKSSSQFVYTVRHVRLKDDVDVNWMRLGMSLKDMLTGSVIEHGEVHSPDGAPRDRLSIGSTAISSQVQALEVAKAALANPNSEIRQKGLRQDTPIYLWRDGKDAELLNGP